jgi:hypothetical protein
MDNGALMRIKEECLSAVMEAYRVLFVGDPSFEILALAAPYPRDDLMLYVVLAVHFLRTI